MSTRQTTRPPTSRWPTAAREAANATADMRPKLGRASYLGDRALGNPDGGAVAVAIWMEAIAGQIGGSEPIRAKA